MTNGKSIFLLIVLTEVIEKKRRGHAPFLTAAIVA
jgi:hypothetical protein